ncbi:MAG: outer membrane protein assembly factor BamD [Burkholderiales bacterium]
MFHSVFLGRILLLTLVLVAGCGLLPEKYDETRGWSAQKLYSEARGELADGNYEKAIKLYETLESRYPYGRYAQQSQLDVAYAYYKDRQTASAVAACDRFIKLHPNHAAVDYAYYLKGLANFNEDLGFMGNLSGQDMSERDPKALLESYDAFRDLSLRYPNSKYTPDAIARMTYLLNSLASHEVAVARYYYKRGAYIAAANRGQNTLTRYPRAPANEEALVIMAMSYDKLGLVDLRDDAERVLVKNFPDTAYKLGGNPYRKWWQIWNIE